MRRPLLALAGLLVGVGVLLAVLTLRPPARPDPFASVTAPSRARLLAAAALRPCPPTAPLPAVPGGLPGVTLRCLGAGPAVHLAGLRGQPTVVNVWAGWCEPCQREAPYLRSLDRRAGARLRVLGVVFEDTERDALDAGRGLGLRYPSVLDADGGAIRGRLGAPMPPLTLLLRPDGTVAYRIIGPIRSQQQIDGLVARYLGVRL